MARQAKPSGLNGLLGTLASGLVAITLLLAVLALPDSTPGLSQEVQQALQESGVAHPVTAVLINFRAYDTWLETGVLLLAVMALLALQRVRDLTGVAAEPPSSLTLLSLVKLLSPIMVLASGYLLWLGKDAPGGAFQAGVVLGAAGVLLKLAGISLLPRLPRWLLHALLILGFAAFLLLALGLLIADRPVLAYPEGWAHTLILILETLLTLATAVTVVVLVTAAAPLGEKEQGVEA